MVLARNYAEAIARPERNLGRKSAHFIHAKIVQSVPARPSSCAETIALPEHTLGRKSAHLILAKTVQSVQPLPQARLPLQLHSDAKVGANGILRNGA